MPQFVTKGLLLSVEFLLILRQFDNLKWSLYTLFWYILSFLFFIPQKVAYVYVLYHTLP